MTSLPTLQRQTLITFISTAGLTFAGFFSTVFFAHFLGAEILGIYFIFFAYYCLFDMFSDAGLGLAAVKKISEGNAREEYYTAYVAFRCITLVLIICVIFLAVPFFDLTKSLEIVPFLIIAIIAGMIYSVTSNGTYGSGMIAKQQSISLLNNLLKIAAQVGFVILGYGFAGLAGGVILGLIAAGLLNWHFLKLRLTRFSREQGKDLLKYSFWIFLMSCGLILFSNADTIILAYFLSASDVGIYKTTFQLTTIATFFTLTMYTVLYPKISNWYANGLYETIENHLTRAFTYSFILAIPTCIGGWILGDRLLYYIYGESFAKGTYSLWILLVFQIANTFLYLQTMSLNAINKPKESCTAMGIAITVNMLLDILLIPFLGIIGAALAGTIAVGINAIITYRVLSKEIRLKLDIPSIKNILLASAAMGIILLVMRLIVPISHFLILVGFLALGTIIYFTILLKRDPTIRGDLADILTRMGIGNPFPR